MSYNARAPHLSAPFAIMRPLATLTFDPFCRGSLRRRSSYMSGMTLWSRSNWAVKSPREYREPDSFHCRAKIIFFWKMTPGLPKLFEEVQRFLKGG